MKNILQGKVVTVVGASGYVGQNMCQQAALSGAKVNGVDRGGQPSGVSQTWHKDINWVKGDAMEAEGFADVLRSSDLVIHSVGTLVDTSVTKRREHGEAGTYEQMNRDTLINVAKVIEGQEKTTLVYISASRSPPFLKRYLTTKQEAEQYLKDRSAEGKLNYVIMKPGFIYSWSQRWWSVPMKITLDIYRTIYKAVDYLVPKQSFLGGIWREFEVDSAVKLNDLVDSSLYAAVEKKLIGKSLNNKKMEETANLFRSSQSAFVN